MKTLIAGADGQLARALARRMAAEGEVVALPRSQLDITNIVAVMETIQRVRPDIVMNGAAYNDVDGAEADPVRALAVNAFGVRALARASADCGATLVHFSTDFVFDGTASEPYTEDDAPNPQSVYATSKLLGEWFAQEARAYVLRVESLFGGALDAGDGARARGSSVDRMADAMLTGRSVRAFTDRTVTASYVVDVAEAVAALLTSGVAPGLYHCVGTGVGTWFDLATELAAHLGRDADIVAVRMMDVAAEWPAQRPQYCALSSGKLAARGIVMPAWRDALARYAEARLASLAG